MKRRLAQVFLALYPLGFVCAPILSLYASNAGTFRLGVVALPILYAILGTALVMALMGLRLRQLRKSAVATSYFAILFFSHGHFHRIAVDLGIAEWLAGWLLFVLGSALAAVGLFGVARARNLALLTRVLGVAAVAMVALPTAHIASFELATRQKVQSARDSVAVVPRAAHTARRDQLPDIYYIVLDGYARHDVLRDRFDYDNEPFLDFLGSRGFRVARRSRANYCQTALSMSSVFNMDYVHNLVVARPQFSDLAPLRERIRNNRVVSMLRRLGYTIVTFSNATDMLELESPDIHFQGRSLDEFHVGVLDLTPVPMLVGRLVPAAGLPLEPYRAHHANVHFKFEQLGRLSEYKRPLFTYAHFLVPHPPFVFDATGTFLDPMRPYSVRERDWAEGYRDGYRRNVQFVNTQLEKTIDAIRAQSTRPPVIILQSDHGPASGWLEFWNENQHWNTKEPHIIRERLPVLNAMLVPGGPPSGFEADVSLVNTFRIVLNECFGAAYDLLPDHSFFSSYDTPYRLYQVDDILNANGDADEEGDEDVPAGR